MKKILIALILSIVSIMCFGQVTVQKSQRDGEVVLVSGNGYIYHNFKTDNYYLDIKSDNQYEEKQIVIKLGTGKEEAIQSIITIENMWEESKRGDVFEVNGIKCTVTKGMFMYIQFDNPPYSAGRYWIGCEFNSKIGLFDRAIKMYKKGKF